MFISFYVLLHFMGASVLNSEITLHNLQNVNFSPLLYGFTNLYKTTQISFQLSPTSPGENSEYYAFQFIMIRSWMLRRLDTATAVTIAKSNMAYNDRPGSLDFKWTNRIVELNSYIHVIYSVKIELRVRSKLTDPKKFYYYFLKVIKNIFFAKKRTPVHIQVQNMGQIWKKTGQLEAMDCV